MWSRSYRVLTLLLVSFVVAACAAAPVSRSPEQEHLAVAKRFLHSWGAGEAGMAAFQDKLAQTYQEQPGLAELMQRAFADVTEQDFEDLAARVYVRHLSQEELGQLAQFTESPTGNRFFRMSVASAMEGKPVTGEDIARQFNADELTEIVRFSRSDGFVALKQNMPAINRELGEEGRVLGETKMREYLERTGQASAGQSG
jgi:hypothetical protein